MSDQNSIVNCKNNKSQAAIKEPKISTREDDESLMICRYSLQDECMNAVLKFYCCLHSQEQTYISEAANERRLLVSVPATPIHQIHEWCD